MNHRLKSLLAEVFQVRESDLHQDLVKADLDSWDSLTQMDLVVSLEKEFSISLDIPDIVRLNSISEIIQVLTEKGVNLGD